MNPYDHLESLQTRRDEKRHLIIDNSEFLCDHGGLNPMKSRKSKYIPEKLYNQIKEIFIKYWNMKRLLGLHSSEDIPDFTHYYISESNTKREKCTGQLWNNMSR